MHAGRVTCIKLAALQAGKSHWGWVHFQCATVQGCWATHPRGRHAGVQVSTTNLERVRRVKNRHVRLTTRVETLREVLEKFLDDDRDMLDMNLSARAAHQLERQVRAPSDSEFLQKHCACTPFHSPQSH